MRAPAIRLFITVALATIAGVVPVVAAPAQADTLNVSFGATPRSGETAIRVRTGPGTGYTALGQVAYGSTIPCWYTQCQNSTGTGIVTGGSYACTSGSGNTWVKVYWSGTLGYMARNCVDLVAI